jgi:8-oxo-dGTP pyrophosphatase MutT (NUDIX family)
MPKSVLEVLLSDTPPEIPAGMRPAAVLVIIHRGTIILTKRASHLLEDPGEIVFPGGKKQLDESFLRTALREAAEEIKALISSTCIAGYLPAVRYQNYFIVPVVAVLDHEPELSPNANEVEEIYQVAFDQWWWTERLPFRVATTTLEILSALRRIAATVPGVAL